MVVDYLSSQPNRAGYQVSTKQGSGPSQQTTKKSEQPAEETTVEQPPAAPAEPEEDPVVGYTEAPGQEEPHVMEKQIASCGDPSIHETGTTFFTDGTSGWTENCAAQMM